VGHRFGLSGLNLTSEGLLLGMSLRLRAKGHFKQPPLAGAQDSKHLCISVRMIGPVLLGVKDDGGL
jgi:hypothetical protein